MMPIRGVHYDVGHYYDGEDLRTTRPQFEPTSVASDMATIAGRLHANAVRVTGTDLSRLATAASAALDADLSVWFSPHPGDLGGDDIVAYLADAARAAEELRAAPGSLVMVAGCEMSLFCKGFVPGDTLRDRFGAMIGTSPTPDLEASLNDLPRALNATLGESVRAIRARFHGPLTYASAPWEAVAWAPFDFVGVDLYRDGSNAGAFRGSVRSYMGLGKPMVVTEFGCCTYRGAAEAGPLGFTVVDYDARRGGWRLTGARVKRSEAEQAHYLREVLATFDEAGVHGAFWHTFAGWLFPHLPDADVDPDVGSFGLVKIMELPHRHDGSVILEPKDAFWALADAYRS